MAMEAINQAGHLKSRLIVLLNDNEMSIAPAVGALSGYLNRIKEAQSYQHLERRDRRGTWQRAGHRQASSERGKVR